MLKPPQLAASSAAAAVLPVPAVLNRVEVGDMSAVLLEMLPGQPRRYTAEELMHVADALDEARAAGGDPAGPYLAGGARRAGLVSRRSNWANAAES